MSKLYQHSLENPYHISVGIVLFNERGEICTHYATKDMVPEKLRPYLAGLPDAHTLIRESLEDDELLSDAVARALSEECGSSGAITSYLGATVNQLKIPSGSLYEKTTLYHAVRLTLLGNRPKDDEESFTTLVWSTPAVLIEKMRMQGQITQNKDLDESEIIERFVKLYETL